MRSLRTNRFCASGSYYYGAREVGATSVVDGAAKAGALRLEVGGPADGGGKAEGGNWISGSRKLRSRTKFADIPERRVPAFMHMGGG